MGVAGKKLYVLDEFVVVVGLCWMSLWMKLEMSVLDEFVGVAWNICVA